MLHPAEPFLRATLLQTGVTPSVKVTAPVGELPLTVAVKVTFWPNVDGFAVETTIVVVAAGLTSCDNIVEVEPRLLVSPEYTAVMECVPTLSNEFEQAALLLVSVAEHNVVLPSLNVTVPVGDLPATVAVNITF